MKAVLVLAGAAAFAAAPFLLPDFGGFRAEAFPVPQDRPPVQPAGFAFAIWGPIYLWLIAHAVFGLLARAEDAVWDAPRWPLIGALAAGAAWLGVALADPLAATLLIGLMLALALVALGRAGGRDRFLLRAPLALFAGWLTAAAFVSLGLVLAGYGIVASGRTAAFLVLPPAVALAAAVQWRLGRVPEYAAAAGWGLLGIAAANLRPHPDIAALAGLGIAVLAMVVLRAPGRPAAG